MVPSILEMFAVAAPGCEAACAKELAALGLSGAVQSGGVAFQGELADLYRANLWLRSASRVLVRFAELRCTSFPEFYRKCVRLPWGRFIRPETPVQVKATSRRSRLGHTGRIAETVSAAIDRALGRGDRPQGSAPQLILARFEDDRATLSIDASGELLHRRGYRQEQGVAPLRETLAAAMLHELQWSGAQPLWDPMCGSGTLLIEAALIAARKAPGFERAFAFERWPHFRAGRLRVLRDKAREGEAAPPEKAVLYGSDLACEVLARAERNAGRAGVAGFIRWHCGDFRHAPLPCVPGVVLCNPPYGQRLGAGTDLPQLFAALGDALRGRCRGWSGGFICPDPELARATGLPLREGPVFFHGGLAARLYLFALS